MTLYCLSDCHGDLAAFEVALALIPFEKPDTQCFILGDLIDGGADSYACLQRAYQLAQQFPQVTVQLGNHEAMFLDFVFGADPLDWLSDDLKLNTTLSFFPGAARQVLLHQLQQAPRDIRTLVRQALLPQHEPLLRWLQHRPLVTALAQQILVHAGIDELAGEWWRQATPDELLLGKYPPTTGHFAKMIIAGHVSAAEVSHDPRLLGHIYYDGASHIFLDGNTSKSHQVPVLRVQGGRYEELSVAGRRLLFEIS